MKEPKGAIISSVVPRMVPPAKPACTQGDVSCSSPSIGKQVEDSRDLSRRVAALVAGASATLTVNRDGKVSTITAKIAPRKEEKVASNDGGEAAPGAGGATGEAMDASSHQAVTAEDAPRNYQSSMDSIDGVVLITKVDPDSDAADKGLQPGDVVMSVSNRTVHTPQEIQKSVSDARGQGHQVVLLLVANIQQVALRRRRYRKDLSVMLTGLWRHWPLGARPPRRWQRPVPPRCCYRRGPIRLRDGRFPCAFWLLKTISKHSVIWSTD